jgi:hypothetical protein
LDVQSVCADGALSGSGRSNVAKVKDKHVCRSSNDGEPKANQYIECVELHFVARGIGACASKFSRFLQ